MTEIVIILCIVGYLTFGLALANRLYEYDEPVLVLFTWMFWPLTILYYIFYKLLWWIK